MSDSYSSFDYGEQVVKRYRASGLTRKEFAERSGISVSTLDYYVRRERQAASPSSVPPNRIVPVNLIPPEENPSKHESAGLAGGIAIRLVNGLAVEVHRGFDTQLLREVLAVLEMPVSEYLLDVLPGMADCKRSEVAELTPTRWKAAKQ